MLFKQASRRLEKGFTSLGRSHFYNLGVLKIWEEQNQILLMEFDNFPTLTKVLHLHLKKNTVMQTEFTVPMSKMEEFCTKAMKLSEKAKKVADLARSTANKKTSKG